ncbi:MAG: zinc finger domain-containing protein [Candidatus Heimdallarchaeota archaeon]|nr:zinc finger domain-containing protein [Candidatus Heimdallarchaeota archaeon]
MRIETDYCYSCNKNLPASSTGIAKFPCPNCGGRIIRCSECRRLSNNYTCPGCDFEGP